MIIRLLYAGILLFFSIADAAQNGKIVGKIIDAETGQPLVGVTVTMSKEKTETYSDLEGTYRFTGLQPGKYEIIAYYSGYTGMTYTGIEIKKDNPVMRLDIVMKPQELVELDRMVVRATSARNSGAALLKDRQKAISISDAVGSIEMSQAGAGNAADAMKQVTGATVVGGKYVFVRGLGERYGNTLLNGIEVPSPDPDKKAVAMDLFPSDLLDNIVTSKTFTPDKSGNFSGGSVNIVTRSFPEQLMLRFSSSASVNTQTFGNDNCLTHEGGGLDWLGMDDGTRALPAFFEKADYNGLPNKQDAAINADSAYKLDEASKSFNPTMAPHRETGPFNQSYALVFGNQFDVFDRPLGVLANLTYNNGLSFFDNGREARWRLTGDAFDLESDLVSHEANHEVLWGGLINCAYKFHPHHETEVTYLHTQNAEDKSLYLSGPFFEDLGGNTYEVWGIEYKERNIKSLQSSGKHLFAPLGDIRLDWKGAWTRSTQDEPDVRSFAYDYDTLGGSYSLSANAYPPPSRYFRKLWEDGIEGQADLSLPIENWIAFPLTAKTGLRFASRERSFRERQFSLQTAEIRSWYNGGPYAFNGDIAAFTGENMGIIDSIPGYQYQIGNFVSDLTSARNRYDGNMGVLAGYGMAEWQPQQWIRFIGGLRIEAAAMDIRSHDTTLYVIDSVFHVAGDSLVFDSLERKQAWHAEKSNRDLLPAASIIFTLSDDMNLRFAYGHTLARPTFREIAPYVSYYPAEGLSVRGNIGLERSTIDNYDVRWEWFMRPGELFAVSPFLKIFTNPIEVSLIPTDNDEITWENSERATVGGIEFEARKKLDQVHRTMKDVTMGGNLSLIYARVDIPQKKLLVMREINPDAPAARAFQGQSPYVLNVNLTYDNGDLTGTSANLYYNIFGRRLHYFSRDLTPDLMEEPRNIFNGNFSQKLWGGLSLKFSVKNILNSPVKYVHRYNETGPEARWYLEMVPFFEYLPFFKKYQGKEYVREEHREGRSFSLGLTYTIK